jgi:hypothetical protein
MNANSLFRAGTESTRGLRSAIRHNFLNSRQYASLGFSNTDHGIPAIFGQSSQAPNASNPINGTGRPCEAQLGLKLIF